MKIYAVCDPIHIKENSYETPFWEQDHSDTKSVAFYASTLKMAEFIMASFLYGRNVKYFDNETAAKKFAAERKIELKGDIHVTEIKCLPIVEVGIEKNCHYFEINHLYNGIIESPDGMYKRNIFIHRSWPFEPRPPAPHLSRLLSFLDEDAGRPCCTRDNFMGDFNELLAAYHAAEDAVAAPVPRF